MDKIYEILTKYSHDDYQIFHNTVEMLCSKGVGGGFYQNTMVLMDVLSILCVCESIIKGD